MEENTLKSLRKAKKKEKNLKYVMNKAIKTKAEIKPSFSFIL